MLPWAFFVIFNYAFNHFIYLAEEDETPRPSFTYSSYRARSGIWKTSRKLDPASQRKFYTSVRIQSTGMNTVDADFQDVPFKVSKCDRICAYLILWSILFAFIFGIIYGYYLMHKDFQDGKNTKDLNKKLRNKWYTYDWNKSQIVHAITSVFFIHSIQKPLAKSRVLT